MKSIMYLFSGTNIHKYSQMRGEHFEGDKSVFVTNFGVSKAEVLIKWVARSFGVAHLFLPKKATDRIQV